MTEDDLKPYARSGFVKDTISYALDKHGNFACAIGSGGKVIFPPAEAVRMAWWILHHMKG